MATSPAKDFKVRPHCKCSADVARFCTGLKVGFCPPAIGTLVSVSFACRAFALASVLCGCSASKGGASGEVGTVAGNTAATGVNRVDRAFLLSATGKVFSQL